MLITLCAAATFMTFGLKYSKNVKRS
jgi:hypothetical protein